MLAESKKVLRGGAKAQRAWSKELADPVARMDTRVDMGSILTKLVEVISGKRDYLAVFCVEPPDMRYEEI